MKEVIKHRTIDFSGNEYTNGARRIEESLGKLVGVHGISSDRPDRMAIKYDLMHINLRAIENKLRYLGFHLSDSIPKRMRRWWIRFTEQNEFDNLNSKHYNCCRDPKETEHLVDLFDKNPRGSTHIYFK